MPRPWLDATSGAASSNPPPGEAAPRQNEPGWVEWRRGFIGASEMPTLVGENGYQTEYELALQKRGDMDPEPENEAMRWGHLVEPLGLQLYREATGYDVRNIHTTTVSRTHPHVMASLDGRRVKARVGVEVKLARWDELPRKVEVQCQGQMAVCRLAAIDVVRLKPYQPPLIITVERDERIGDALLDLSEAWYERYVLGDEMPPIDGSRGASRALDAVLGPPEMKADDKQAEMVARIAQLKAAIKAAQADHDLVVNRLKDSMHGSYALVGTGFRVSWKPTKPRHTTDWKAVANDYRALLDHVITGDELPEELRDALPAAPLAHLDAVEARHTTEQEGARPFRVTIEEGS